jgi:hypothetical protein
LRKEELKRLGVLLIAGGILTPFTPLMTEWLHGNLVFDVESLFLLLPHGFVTAVVGVIVCAIGIIVKEEARML